MLKSDGKDPCGAIHYSRYERTRVERVWKDVCNTESECRNANPRAKIFQMNLANKNTSSGLLNLKHSHNRLELIADKEISQSPAQRSDVRGVDKDSYEVNMMRSMELTPPERFDIPMTSSQNIGWLISAPCKAKTLRNMSKFKDYSQYHPRAPKQDDTMQQQNRSASDSSLPRTWPHIPCGPHHPQIFEMNKKGQFYKPKNFCEVTRYADTYTSLMGTHPFSNQNK